MLKPRPFLVEALTAIGLFVAPFVLPHLGFSPTTINRILIWGLFGLGFDILFGFTGLLSFGQSAFFGTGGMVAAYLLTQTNFPYVTLAIFIGTIVAAVGRLSRRPDRASPHRHLFCDDHGGDRRGVLLRRVQPAVGLHRRRERLARRAAALGLTRLHDAPFRFRPGRCTAISPFWFFVGLVIARRIVHSPVGAVLRAIRDNPLRAAAVGHNIRAYKLTAFVVAAAYAGFAGGLLGVMQGFMPPDAFMFDTSGQLVMQTAIGGAGTLFGPLVGAAIWLYLSDFFQNTLHLGATWKLVLGIVFVLLVVFLRHGVIGGVVDLWSALGGPAREPAAPRRREPDPIGAPADRSAPSPRPPRTRRSRAMAAASILRDARAHAALRRPARQPAISTSRCGAANCAASSDRTAPARARSSRC